jgi:hypothetical protein
MRIPAVMPIVDYPMSEVLKCLRNVTNDLRNNSTGSATEVLEKYQRWSSGAAEQLGYMFDGPDV